MELLQSGQIEADELMLRKIRKLVAFNTLEH